MARPCPPTLVAVAILNLVFGALALLCGGCGLASNAILMTAAAPPQIAEMASFVSREVPAYRLVEIAKPALVMFLGLAVMVAGLATFFTLNWARRLTAIYGLMMVGLQFTYSIYEIFLVQPAIQRWAMRMNGPVNPGQDLGTTMGIVGAAVLFGLHGLVCLIIVFLPPIAAAFSSDAKMTGD